MDESNWKKTISRNFLPHHHLHKIGCNLNFKTLNGVNTKTLNFEITDGETQVVKSVKATDSLQNQ